jgi:hypothetical protein
MSKKLTITTRKAEDFKTFPAEGAIGGITPSQMYQINFYVEAPNIPDEITHELSEDGKLGAQIDHKMKGGDIIRELQCALVMTIPQAESLARWILSTIKSSRDGEVNGTDMVM